MGHGPVKGGVYGLHLLTDDRLSLVHFLARARALYVLHYIIIPFTGNNNIAQYSVGLLSVVITEDSGEDIISISLSISLSASFALFACFACFCIVCMQNMLLHHLHAVTIA